ncbi:hypothetical protein [Polaribacter cellanae]|uniref:Uncharacterized protein n=1 Tax=Polaribacter cellanae TaxID=2818493 RepID=A0A975H6Q1_9FLAO|nr:hypothetical protein [Polaribacter cellanae]QTE22154.1 hypothetical protein J3359_15270 [Polaribacter cellanae]
MKTISFMAIFLIVFCSCETQKNSGEIVYSLINDNHTLIKNQLQGVPENKKDSLYSHYTSLFPKYDTLKVKVFFDIKKRITKEIILSSTSKKMSDYYEKAKVVKYRKNNTSLIWMETFNGHRYKIKETLDPKNHMIPYYDGLPKNLKESNPIHKISTQNGKITFAGNYPQQTSGEFDVWFAEGQKLSVGPQELFIKDLFVLKAISKDKSLIINADSIKFKKLEKNLFDIPNDFYKEVSMEEYHKIMGI